MKKVVCILLVCVVILLFSLNSFAAPRPGNRVTYIYPGEEYFIENAYSGRYLNVYKNLSANGTNIDTYSFDGTSGQRFKFVEAFENTKFLVPSCAPKSCVNIYGYTPSLLSNINVWKYTMHEETQFWDFDTVDDYSDRVFIYPVYNPDVVMATEKDANRSNVYLESKSKYNYKCQWYFREIIW